MYKNKVVLASIFIVIGGLFRIFPHPVNISPVAAMALLGGAYLGRNYLAFLVPILALFIGDLILNNTINRAFFSDQSEFIIGAQYMYYTYGAYLLTVLLGFYLINKSSATKIIAGTLVSSILFFAITNIGVWLSGTLYPTNGGGLIACITAAMPFFRNTLLSNAIFISLFVLAIEFMTRSTESKSQLA